MRRPVRRRLSLVRRPLRGPPARHRALRRVRHRVSAGWRRDPRGVLRREVHGLPARDVHLRSAAPVRRGGRVARELPRLRCPLRRTRGLPGRGLRRVPRRRLALRRVRLRRPLDGPPELRRLRAAVRGHGVVPRRSLRAVRPERPSVRFERLPDARFGAAVRGLRACLRAEPMVRRRRLRAVPDRHRDVPVGRVRMPNEHHHARELRRVRSRVPGGGGGWRRVRSGRVPLHLPAGSRRLRRRRRVRDGVRA